MKNSDGDNAKGGERRTVGKHGSEIACFGDVHIIYGRHTGQRAQKK